MGCFHCFGKKTKSIENTITEEITEECFLQQVKYKDVEKFNLKGYSTKAKIVRLYDGDSFYVVFFYKGQPVKFKCRLANIDCAEKKSEDPIEVEHANKALHRLEAFISESDDGLVFVKFQDFGNYGRLLTELFLTEGSKKSFNQILLDEGLAYKYKGGKRKAFKEWISPDFFIS